MANWWDTLGTGIGDSLIGMQTPFGMSPPNLDPAQRKAMIANSLITLGGNIAGSGKNPAVGLARGVSQLQQNAGENLTRGAYFQQLQDTATERKAQKEAQNRTREAAKRSPLFASYPPEVLDTMEPAQIFNVFANANKPQNPPNWTTFTTGEGVFAMNPENPQQRMLLGPPSSNRADAPTGYQRNPDGSVSRLKGYKDTDYESKIRTEFQGQTKDFRDARDSYMRIQASAQNPSPAGDLALIFNYMKMLDPGSVVRESEFATAQNAAPWLTRVGIDPAKVAGVWAGQRLTPEQRQDFISRADAIYSQQESTFNTLAKEYEDLATKNGLDPESIILTPRARRSNAPDGQPDQDGWVTLPNGVRYRQVK